MSEDGRLKPPYGGSEYCRNLSCGIALTEETEAYLHKNRESGKLIVFCGECSRQAQLYDSLRLPLVAL